MSFDPEDPVHKATLEDLLIEAIVELRVISAHLSELTDTDNESLRDDAREEAFR